MTKDIAISTDPTARVLVVKKHRKPKFVSRILRWELFWVLLLAPSVLLTEYFWDLEYRLLFIAYLFLFWPIRLIVQRGRILPIVGLTSVTLILAGIVVGIREAGGIDKAWESAGYILFGIAMLVGLVNWRHGRRNPRLLLYGFMVIAVALSIFGPESFSVNPRKLLDVYAPGSVASPAASVWDERINPNILAGALVPFAPLFLALSLWSSWRRRPWLPLLSLVVFILLTNAVILTQSRAGYLAVGGGIATLLLLRWPRLFYLLPVLLLGMAAAFFSTSITDITIGSQAASELLNQAVTGLENRRLLREVGSNMLLNNWLSGIGFGQFDELLKEQYAEYLPYFFNAAPPHSHNLLLQVGLDLGIVGLLGGSTLVVWLFYSLIRRLAMHGRSANGWPESAGLLSSLVALCLFGIYDVAAWGTKLSFIPFGLVAFGILWINYDAESMD